LGSLKAGNAGRTLYSINSKKAKLRDGVIGECGTLGIILSSHCKEGKLSCTPVLLDPYRYTLLDSLKMVGHIQQSHLEETNVAGGTGLEEWEPARTYERSQRWSGDKKGRAASISVRRPFV
jgi:hypothetical protein